VGLSIMADTSREHPTAGGAIGGFKRIMQLPGTFAHALAVMVRLIVSYQQAAGQNGATQSAAYTTAVSQRYAERCRNSNGLSVTQAAVKGLVQGHENRLGAQQLPGVIQISCALFNPVRLTPQPEDRDCCTSFDINRTRPIVYSAFSMGKSAPFQAKIPPG
jgi:hypothetical protein